MIPAGMIQYDLSFAFGETIREVIESDGIIDPSRDYYQLYTGHSSDGLCHYQITGYPKTRQVTIRVIQPKRLTVE